ncbi:mycothione reductase [Leucobacter sp. CSA1]|uniref:Mycothione reductase n=1 Tax=Leucobacter chromiisoli TaxID=2796471 RepID=A0A934Q7F5_9MICO|nr:mycothione reductase [Leucobacter chromiisoli]MBK0418227.1 mycothione reductase [Leucobacter chromiisoli]
MTTLTADLAIIGSGSGNTLITPHWEDKRVVLAEQGTFGGTCLNVGCIPTKMFVRPSEAARGPEEAARLNVTQRTEAVDWVGMRDRIFSRIDPISDAGRRYRDELENVELIEQRVRLAGARSFVAEDGTRVEAERLVIAAGSRPVLPDVPGIHLPHVHTSDTVMRIDSLPRRVLVVGGGFIACEFAGIFSGLGAEVVQINRGPRLMRGLDEEISRAYTEEAGKNWTVRCGRVLSSLAETDDGAVTAEILVRGAQSEEEVREPGEFDIVLVALGRRPNSDLVGAAEAGLDLHGDGRIAVDAFQRVLSGGRPVDGLFALGDICSELQLKHVANHEARVVAHNLEHPDDLRESRRDAVPSAVFTHPELASVGLTETQAVERIGAENVTCKVQRYGDTAYGWAMEDRSGLFKTVADRRDGRILGACVMGYQASNLIQPVVTAMSFGIDAHTFARGQYWIHPALMEVTENALLGLDVPAGERPPL